MLCLYAVWHVATANAQFCVPPPSGIVSWWPANGDATDFFGANNGTLKGGAIANAPGEVSTAFQFDGTNGFVQIPNSAALEPTNLTVEAWVLFNSLNSTENSAPGQQYIVFKQNSRSGNFEGYDLGKQRSGGSDHFYFQVASSSGTEIEVNSTNPISTGVWYHVAGVRGSNYIQLYVNGRLQGQVTVSFPQDYSHLPLLLRHHRPILLGRQARRRTRRSLALQPPPFLQRDLRDLPGRRRRKMPGSAHVHTATLRPCELVEGRRQWE